MLSLAALRKEEGDLAAAEPLYTEAVALRRSLNGDDDPLTLSATMALGLLLRAKGPPEDLAQAAVLLSAAEERCRSVLGAQHPDTILAGQSLGSLLQQQAAARAAAGAGTLDPEGLRLLARAEPLLSTSLSVWKRLYAPDDPETLNRSNTLANLRKDLGDLDGAEQLLREAQTPLRRAPFVPRHPSHSRALTRRADRAAGVAVVPPEPRARRQGPADAGSDQQPRAPAGAQG